MTRERLGLPLSFDELMRRHEREIMRYLLRATGDREDAADLFQETWLRAYRAYPRLNSESEVRPWLYAIAANLCRNRLRDRARRPRTSSASDGSPSLEESAAKRDRNHCENDGYAAIRMREMIARLPEKQRTALCLRYFAGLEYGDIAAAAGCSEQSARANVSHALRQLKAKW